MFRFEKTWVHEAGCEDVIAGAWDVHPAGIAMFQVVEKIKNCRINLIRWSQAHVRITPKLIEAKSQQLQVLEQESVDNYDGATVKALKCELNTLRAKEEMMWCQRSRISWLMEGDQNTRFFHECASHRRRTNTILGLQDQNHIWQTSPAEIEWVAVDYFN